MGKLTAQKARLILRHGEVRGETLTPQQKGFFGLLARGGRPTRLSKKAKKARK